MKVLKGRKVSNYFVDIVIVEFARHYTEDVKSSQHVNGMEFSQAISSVNLE
jgi:hypothetical protein